MVNPLAMTRLAVRILTSSTVAERSSGCNSLYRSRTFSSCLRKLTNTESFALRLIALPSFLPIAPPIQRKTT